MITITDIDVNGSISARASRVTENTMAQSYMISNRDVTDGEGAANLTYRTSALYSPRDPVLGESAGLKHFGKRRLGRSGLDLTYPVPDNVWDMDCTDLFPDATPAADVHSAYFASPNAIEKMRSILQGIDRSLIGE